jgi:Alpha/beta hydrolase family
MINHPTLADRRHGTAAAVTWFVPVSVSGTSTSSSNDDDDPPWMTVYYFPHAGGSAESALAWWTNTNTNRGNHHDDDIAVPSANPDEHHTPQKPYPYKMYVVALPGRGRRLDETSPANLPDLVDLIATQLVAHCETPTCVLWGHSFGALLASQVATKILLLHQQQQQDNNSNNTVSLTHGVVQPTLLLVSGHPFGNGGARQVEFYRHWHHKATTTATTTLDQDMALLHSIEQFGLLTSHDRDGLLQAEPRVREFVLAPWHWPSSLIQMPLLSTTTTIKKQARFRSFA